MPNTLLKHKYSNKYGSGCRMCKPQKHKWADRRDIQEKKKDIDTLEQLQEVHDQELIDIFKII